MKKRLLSLFSLALAAAVLLSACNQSPALKKLDRLNQKNPTATADTRQGKMQHRIHTDTGGQDENSPVQKYKIKAGKNSATQNVKAVAVSGGKNEGTAAEGAGSTGTGNGESGDEALPIEDSTTGVPMTEIIDATTAPVPLPKDVKTVAATGGVAEMVEMLKNSGQKLVATSQEAKSGLFYSLFSPKDVGLKDAAVLDDNEYNELLSAKVRPQVVFYTEGAYDEAQLKTLRAAGIYPVALYDYDYSCATDTVSFPEMPALNFQELNVQIVAKVLSGDASSYINYCKAVTKEIKSNCYNGSGIQAVINDLGETQIMSSVLGYVSDLEVNRCRDPNNNWYYYYRSSPMSNEGIHLFYNFSQLLDYDIDDARDFVFSKYPEYMLFQNMSLKTKFQSHMKELMKVPLSLQGTIEYPDARASTQDFRYLVNPKGACSWIEQSPECILEAYFLAAEVRNYSGGTGNPEGFVKSKISSFYKDYLHVNLTDVQVSEIYNGPQD